MKLATLPRFTEKDFRYWAGRVGPWFDATGPAGNHLLEYRRVNLSMFTGIYIGARVDDTPLYVGKVKRHDRGVDDRFRAHHQPVELFDSVWLLPIHHRVPDRLLLHYESMVIRHHQPLWNVMNYGSVLP